MASIDEIYQVVEEAVHRAVQPLDSRLSELQLQQHALGDALLSLGAESNLSSIRPNRTSKPPLKRHESASKIGAATAGDIDPVMTGDLVYLFCRELDTPGILSGDMASKRTGVQAQESSRESLNFDDYIFRLYPMLNYRHRNEADSQADSKARAKRVNKDIPAMTRGASEFTVGRELRVPRQISIGNDDVLSREALILQRVEAEVHANNTWMRQLDNGQSKEVVKYGTLYQLMHLKSGRFLSICDDAAPLDPDCRALSLSEGSSASYFKIVPRFKAQTEGSIVYFGHSLVLESGKLPGTYVHTSPIAYDETPNPFEPTLPKCLQTRVTFEANASPQGCTFTVYKHGRFDEEEAQQMHSGQPFRLYHSQSESFMHASCDPEKDARGGERQHGIPLHIPYLKVLIDNGSDPDPTNPVNHLCKGVWCFEPASTRTVKSVVCWDSAVRLRHVPSGRYLAVDTSQPIATPSTNSWGGEGDAWFSTFLVDDAYSAQEDYSEVSTMVLPEQMVFRIMSADKTSDEHVPNVDVSIRVEHHYADPESGHKRILYLSNTDVRKPIKTYADGTKAAKSTSAIGSYQMVFSTQRSAQDILKVMHSPAHELRTINMVKSLLVPCNLYISATSNPSIPIREDMRATVALMLRIIDLCHRGTSHHEDLDWIAVANSTMPAAFSKMFDGAPDPFAQKICRDMKLMDTVFAMGTAAYDRTYPDNPWAKEPIGDMAGPKAIQKFIHVCLQCMVSCNPENQTYFGKRQSAAHGAAVHLMHGKAGGAPLPRQKLWMDTILEQLEDALGPAVTLSKLLSANETLLHKYATPKLVLRFADMVRKLGPQPRLVNFFEAICTVEGRAVKANQEMVLRLTWMREEMRRRIYLEVREVKHADVADLFGLKQYPPVFLPSRDTTNGKFSEGAKKGYPQAYLSKDIFEQPGGFNPVFVDWLSTKEWRRGVDELWWSPDSMDIPTTKVRLPTSEGAEERVVELVRLEELCWVLNGPALCEAITGISWPDFCEQKKSDVEMGRKFQWQNQLAGYFVGQLTLHCAMCTDRSSSAIAWLEKSYSYTLLASMCYNPHLPQQVRAAATDFVRVLYLDRYPQMQKCGRPSLPETLWVYDLGEHEGRLDVSLDSVPLVRPLSLSDPNALPSFTIPRSHHLHGDPDPLNGFPTHFKFFVLRNLANDYMKGFGSGTLVHAHREENQLAGAICKVVVDLLSFGFQSSLPKLRELVPVLVRFLDGRSDCKSFDPDKGFMGQFEPFDPPRERYLMTSVSPVVTSLKVTVINCLSDIADLRGNFRLAKLLYIFKQYNQDPRMCIELKRFHRFFDANKESRYVGPLTDRLFEDFEALFTTGDGKSLNLEDLSGGIDVNVVLLDCLMYEDDALFAAALSLLERQYMQRRKILRVIKETILLPLPDVPVFGTVDVMISELSYLHSQIKAYPVWGICSRVSGAFGPDKYKHVLDTLDRLLRLFYNDVQEPEQKKRRPSLSKQASVDDRAHTGWGVLKANLEKLSSGVVEMAHGMGSASPGNMLRRKVHEVKENHGDEEEEVKAFGDFVKRRRARRSKGRPVFKVYQDVARSLNVRALFEEGLAIDYNLVFKGSICSPEQKVQSREMLVTVQRKVFVALLQFIRDNQTNQRIVFESCLNGLRSHLGPLHLPLDENFSIPMDADMSFPTLPGMGAEEVIIECLRGNPYLCEEKVPRDLFESFADLLDTYGAPRGESLAAEDDTPSATGSRGGEDLSTSVLWQFFETVCEPTGPAGSVINRNQLYTVDVLLSNELPAIRATVESVFGFGPLCSAPANVARVLCACLREGNVHAASVLQHNRMTMDATLNVIENLMNPLLDKHEWRRGPHVPPSPAFTSPLQAPTPHGVRRLSRNSLVASFTSGGRGKTEIAAVAQDILGNEYLIEMVQLFSYQMEILVVDPRLYRRESAWVLISFVARTLLSRFVLEHASNGSEDKPLPREMWDEIKEELTLIRSLLRITRRLIDGARHLGLGEFETKYHEYIYASPNSLLNTAVKILKSEVAEKVDVGIEQEATALIEVLDSTRLLSMAMNASFKDPAVDSSPTRSRPSNLLSSFRTPSALNLRANRSDARRSSNPNDLNAAAAAAAMDMRRSSSHMEGTMDLKAADRGSAGVSRSSLDSGGIGDRAWGSCDSYGGGASEVPNSHPSTHTTATRDQAVISETASEDHHEDQEEEQLEEEAIDMAGTEEEQGPSTMLQYMTEAVANNPRIQKELLLQRFQLAEVLEDIENLTDPNRRQREWDVAPKPHATSSFALTESDHDSEPLYGVKVTWGDLVDRMVRYAKAHNFDADEVHCIRVFEVLRACVLRAQSTPTGEKIHFDTNSDTGRAQLKAYREKQVFLDARGVTSTALLAISTHSAGVHDNLADHALDLLMELLYGGSSRVQLSVYHYICEEDKDAKFLNHLKLRMAMSQDVIKERKQRVSGGFESMTETQRAGYENAQQTFEMIQQMCEGHNVLLQDILREQPMHQSEINLLHEVLKMFSQQADTLDQLQRMEEAEVELLCVTMDVVTEMLQGPCPGNQEYVTKHEAFLHSIDKVLRGEIHVRVNKGLRLRVKVKAMVLLASMLEGRRDKIVHRKMVNMFEPKVFELVHGYFSRTLLATLKSAENTLVKKDDIMMGVVCLQRVVGELNGLTGYDALSKAVLMEQRKKNKNVTALDHVAVIEAFWKGHVEAVSFPLPDEMIYLSTATKRRFMEHCELSTAEKRVKQLLSASPVFITEMCETFNIAEKSRVYNMLYHNITSIKWCMYALVVLLNLNVVMASYGAKHPDKGYRSAWQGMTNRELNPKWLWSLYLTWVIGFINAAGYIVIVGYLGINEVPIVIRQTDQWVEECLDNPSVRGYYKPSAFNWAGVSLAGVILFIFMHVVNYRDTPNVNLYLFLLLGVNLPWTIICLRRYIVVPTTKTARIFVIIYDIILKKPFFRNHVLLMGASVAGFYSSPFFTLMLLDIVNNSNTLQDIIRSITRPFPQLAVVFYTFVITVAIYAQFGLEYFEEWFHYDSLADDEEVHGCHSVVGCFWLIFYQGVPFGTLGEVVDNVSNRDGLTFLYRLAYDLSFFVWVGILLFNIITGLIVDTFSELRQEAHERHDVLTNSCFVCGITRTAYEDIGLPHGSTFDQHRDEVHNVWNYVYFYLYLQRKDPTEYNGVESYVSQMLRENSLGWLPVRTSLVIEDQGLQVEQNEDSVHAELKAAFTTEIGGLAREMSSVAQRIDHLESTVESAVM